MPRPSPSLCLSLCQNNYVRQAHLQYQSHAAQATRSGVNPTACIQYTFRTSSDSELVLQPFYYNRIIVQPFNRSLYATAAEAAEAAAEAAEADAEAAAAVAAAQAEEIN